MAKVSIWSYVSKMDPENFKNAYREFPKNVRLLLNDYLENQPWEFVSGSDLFNVEMANTLTQKLVEELEKISRMVVNETHLVLQFAQRITQQDPLQTVMQVKSLLENEKSIVLKKYPQLSGSLNQKREEMHFNVQIMKLQHKIKQVTRTQQEILNAKENLNFHNQMHEMASLEMQWKMLIEESFIVLESVQKQAIKRINIWKKQQQLAGNGSLFDESLLPLQERVEIVFTMNHEMDRMVKDLNVLGEHISSGFQEKIKNSMQTLITSSLLVDKQPPQVLKTQSKFQASVNFLLGSRLLSGATKMPVVKAHIITEKRAQEIFLSSISEAWTEGAGEIENGKSVLEIAPNSRSCGAVFKNMLLKKIKRCERKGSESVTEEKCALLFTAEIHLNSTNTTFHIKTLSLPVVVIVHGNQDNNAKATILWDNAFSEVERRPFFVEEKVPWFKMCQTLNMKFTSEVGTKQVLLQDHFVFLSQKIFNDNSLNDDKDRMVSWSQFNKEPLRDRNFTFWQWFDGVVDLTKKCLKDYWSDGLIMGFISKQYLYNLLSDQPDGTFLLRFSDSEIGGITIAHVLRREDGFPQIQNIKPFTAKDLNILSLGDRVRDLNALKYLYKDKPKDEVFGRHYSKKTSKTPDGYTPTQITLMIAGEPAIPKIKETTWPANEIKEPCSMSPPIQIQDVKRLENFPVSSMFEWSPIAASSSVPTEMNQPQYPMEVNPWQRHPNYSSVSVIPPHFTQQDLFSSISLPENDINMDETFGILETLENALPDDFGSSHELSIALNTDPNWMS